MILMTLMGNCDKLWHSQNQWVLEGHCKDLIINGIYHVVGVLEIERFNFFVMKYISLSLLSEKELNAYLQIIIL